MPMVDAEAGSFFYVLEESRILFVDDDPILREFAVVHLSTETARVRTAGDGEEALRLLEAEPFDLVLMDLEMPRLDGFDTLSRMRADPRLARLPVVVVTGREDVSAIDRAFIAGATSFVVKPLNWRLLAYQLRYVQRSATTEARLAQAREQAREEAERSLEALRALACDGAQLIAQAMGGAPELRRAAVSYGEALSAAARPRLAG